MYLRGRFPFKHNSEIKEMLNQKMTSMVYEEECTDIIKYMYNQEDSEVLLGKLRKLYTLPQKNMAELYYNSLSLPVTNPPFITVRSFQERNNRRYLLKRKRI